MKILYLMTGCPGSGKSSFIKDYISKSKNPEKIIRISRDEIRFSLLKEGEDYFSKEKEVYKLFIKRIRDSILDKEHEEIFIDATHLNEKARKKILNNIGVTFLSRCKIISVFIDEPLQTCIDRNNKRTGLEKVPTDRLTDMWFSIEHPKKDAFKYDEVWDICNTGRKI